MKEKEITIKFEWLEHDHNDSFRVGAMYCFKKCEGPNYN